MRKDWEVKKLGDICEIQNGYAFRSALFREQGLPILRISNIQNDAVTLDNIVYFLESDYNIDLDRFKVYPGDTVIALSGATTGKIGINKTDLTFYLNQRVALCRESNTLIKGYLFYYLRTKTMELLSMAGGVAQPNLSTNQIQQLLISVPTFQIQQKIVEELDCLTSIIEKQKKQLEELDNLAQSIFYDMFGDPIENEKGWNVKTLGELCKTSSGGTPSKSIAEYFKGDILWLRSGEIKDMYLYDTEIKISDSALKNSNAKIFPVNTVVVAMYGATVGQVGIIKNEMATNQAVCGIFVNNEILSEIYLYYRLKECRDVFLSAAIGGGQPNISQNIIRNTLVSLPPLPLQQQFAAKIEAIEKQKALIKKSIKETEDLFNSRMDYYFN